MNKPILFRYLLTVFFLFKISQSTIMVGAYGKKPVSECLDAFASCRKDFEEMNEDFSKITVTDCQTQVVSGTNYLMEIKLNSGKLCNVVVWHTLKGNYELDKSKSDCFGQEQRKQNNLTKSNSNKAYIYKGIWLFFSLFSVIFLMI